MNRDFYKEIRVSEEVKERLERTAEAIRETAYRIEETNQIIESERGDER